jgi:asparagine synthase (glutamine-hydrolysing)
VDNHKRIGLAHRRLSIIDLSPAAGQPMCLSSGPLVVVFNGEIYNHAEVRRELERLGVRGWHTDHSDTEVLLRAFAHWGVACLQRLRGMFAFALWDGPSRTLWLARDRVGIKPLYYTVHNHQLVFASEIKALLADARFPRRLNEESFYHYLSFLAAPAPETFFEGVKKLPGGHWMKVGPDGSLMLRRYWDAWDHTEPLVGVKEEEVAERILTELRAAVELRAVSDVPVGIFLSGGIDSSTNAALFNECTRGTVKTFSVGYRGGEVSGYSNELPHARRVASQVGAEHHEVVLTLDDVLEFLPEMIRLQDEPIGDPVCVPLYFVSKLARENGVIVAQVGEGADELFVGYPSWLNAVRLDAALRHIPAPARRPFLSSLDLARRRHGWRREYLRRLTDGEQTFWSGAEAFTETEKAVLLSPRMREQFRDLTSWVPLAPLYKQFTEKAWDQSLLNWMTHSDLHLRLPELLLMRVDKMSMGVSLEARVPFLDHKLIELALSIPAEMKLRGGVLKRLLKSAVRGLIPDDIIDRPKQGFILPVHEYVLDTLGDYSASVLLRFAHDTDLVDTSAVKEVLMSGNGSRIWYLLNFALWHDHFISGAATD